MTKSDNRRCENGHRFYKTTDCPTCPVCWAEQRQHLLDNSDLPKSLNGPTLRALLSADITSVSKLSEFSQAQILKLHGIGPSSMPILRQALQEQGLDFAD